MSRPAMITVPNKPGIVDFMRRLADSREAEVEKRRIGMIGNPQTMLSLMQQAKILRIFLRGLAQGNVLPMRIDTSMLFVAWESMGLLDDLEIRSCFDRACAELAAILQYYKPLPAPKLSTSPA